MFLNNLTSKLEKLPLFFALSILVTLTACNSDSTDDMVAAPLIPPAPVVYNYEVNVVNLTQAQPMSPVAVVLHNEDNIWRIGSSASLALEKLAESGDNSEVLSASMALAAQGGAGILLPGAAETIMLSITDTQPMMLSLATMLVNTNDAFTGVNAMSLGDMAMGDSISFTTNTYDAGTEKNSELMATIPGPAAGGEGFNAMRDDFDKVTMHAGIVSKDDGLTQSVLAEINRFDNPTLLVTITRTQ
jgi:spondin N